MGFPWRGKVGSETREQRRPDAIGRCSHDLWGGKWNALAWYADRCELWDVSFEEHSQVGRQIEDKVLRDSVPDKRARELAIEKIRRLYAAPKQHHGERTVVLPGRPKESLGLGMGSVDLLGPNSESPSSAPSSCRSGGEAECPVRGVRPCSDPEVESSSGTAGKSRPGLPASCGRRA